MVERMPLTQRSRNFAALSVLALFIALLLAYSNHFHNSFHFDDFHSIVNNVFIRDLRHVPRFFADAALFSVEPSGAMSRPVALTQVIDQSFIEAALQVIRRE